jgi:hypothetical protein
MYVDVATFLANLKCRAPLAMSVENPLDRVQQFIDLHGSTGEGKALLAVVQGLWKRSGQFSASEIYAFSSDSLALISALIDAREAGLYPEWKWHRASCYPSWRFLLDLQRQYGIS